MPLAGTDDDDDDYYYHDFDRSTVVMRPAGLFELAKQTRSDRLANLCLNLLRGAPRRSLTSGRMCARCGLVRPALIWPVTAVMAVNQCQANVVVVVVVHLVYLFCRRAFNQLAPTTGCHSR